MNGFPVKLFTIKGNLVLMNNFYHKIAVVYVGIALCFALGATKETKAAPVLDPQRPAPTAQRPAPNQKNNCDPSYPDVCIPPPPPRLNCRDIPHRRFRVRQPDPHGFDRDRDGIGCEK